MSFLKCDLDSISFAKSNPTLEKNPINMIIVAKDIAQHLPIRPSWLLVLGGFALYHVVRAGIACDAVPPYP